jgi:glycosyltransferase involved in cell wall biosynthesis
VIPKPTPLRVVHVSTHDAFGGAAGAARRLHEGLLASGCDSQLYVASAELGGSRTTVFQPPMDFPERLLRAARRANIRSAIAPYRDQRPADAPLFSDDRTQFGPAVIDQIPSCDIINLHWVAGSIDYRLFFRQVPRTTPVVWTCHDMNPFTGGCHYDEACGRFTAQCGQCPQLGSQNPADLSRHIWRRKEGAFSLVPPGRLRLVSPSQWLAGEARRSRLAAHLPIDVIPNGVDTRLFRPQDRLLARDVFGIPKNASVILFAAHHLADRRKGFSQLLEAIASMASSTSIHVLALGAGTVPENFPHPILPLGYTSSEHLLSLVYSAADVFAIPAEQDNLPNTVLESLACGTPVVGFSVGGVPEAVRPGVTGLLAPSSDVRALRKALSRILNDPQLRAGLSGNCRKIAVEEYSLERQAARYAELYRTILSATQDIQPQ